MITELLSFFSPYVYIEYVLAVLLFTELVKKAFAEADLHPKWVTLGVAIVMAIVGVVIQLSILHNAIEFWKLITSVGVSCLCYDYLLKPIKDKFFSK